MDLLKVFTGYSGVGSPEQALKNLKLKHRVIGTVEYDKYARTTYLANHTTERMEHDMGDVDFSTFEQSNLAIFGFPCQTFSIAGKRKGFDDVRGTQFFNVAEFIKVNQPETFILENVKGLLSHDGGRTMQTIVDVLSNGGGTVNGQMSLDMFEDGLGYHIYYQVLNTKQHGIPQNRERVFIVGFKEPRNFSFPKTEPLKLKLKDLLETEIDEKYYLSDKMISYLTAAPRSLPFTDPETKEVSNCILANQHKMSTDQEFFKVKSATKRGYEEAKEGDSINFSVPNSETRRGRVGKGVAQTLDTACNQAVLVGKMKRTENGKKIRARNLSQGHDKMPMSERELIFEEQEYSDTILANSNPQKEGLICHEQIRRLTPRECFRLQNFPDSFNITEVSDTQAYKQAGNSITVRVIQKVIANIYGVQM